MRWQMVEALEGVSMAGQPGGMERLAEFRVTLYCPTGLSEEQQDRLCDALEEVDFRTKFQEWVSWYTRVRRVLRGVTVEVEE